MEDAGARRAPVEKSFDVVVVDASSIDGGCALEVVVTAGERKGDVLELRSPGLDVDPVELLGLPGTVTVVDGEPRLTLS